MSDNQDENKKQMKGFALPENRKNISRGRKKGSKNKIPSDKDFRDMILRTDAEAFETVLSIMRNTNSKEDNRVKIAFKIMDTSIQLRVSGDLLEVSKTDKDGKEESYTVGSKKTGTDGKVVSIGNRFISTDYNQD